MKKLTAEYGVEPKECGYGVTATLGHGEEKFYASCRYGCSLPCRKKVENYLHVTDRKELTHVVMTSMQACILTAAKMLKENEAELEGTVKFMFQPAEEKFQGGSKNMLENGILENPQGRCSTCLPCVSWKKCR